MFYGVFKDVSQKLRMFVLITVVLNLNIENICPAMVQFTSQSRCSDKRGKVVLKAANRLRDIR